MLLALKTVYNAEEDWRLRYTLSVTDDPRCRTGKNYTLLVSERLAEQEEESILLDEFTDEEAIARRVFAAFVAGAVTVCTAEDVLWELL